MFDKMTIKELREFAAKKKINLQGRDKKQDIIDTIKGARVGVSEPEGELHEKAVAFDFVACQKATK